MAPKTGTSAARQAVGHYGENVAAGYLQDKGLRIVERNWRCAAGEIDIVAYDDATACLVVVEVKTRRSETYGSPLEAVTWSKAARLRRLAASWLEEHRARPASVRIDVIGVIRPRRGPARVTHVQDVTA
ncbi:YraN family protein [Luteipulveratus mongoliensis]|uniref:UPF0102 protein VV02_11905 n=1 Tax=Luteipulveratus mongoliensis TaxID=571913 RepID=A0A0K1JI54_9MICO|nr:YraN family protein [Luteipulveratus mongoliensis]AKU16402.1 hypothetical protein VV02_11905 [Luteipulveratus mongoliensis]